MQLEQIILRPAEDLVLIQHRDNVGLRTVMQNHKPLIYMWGVVRGRYMPSWPTYVVNDNLRTANNDIIAYPYHTGLPFYLK